MASWFVRKTGNDANAGTSAGAAWLTIQKAHNAGAGPTGGDQVYVGAGTYREVVSANMTAPTSELQFIADVDGSQTGDAGPVIWSAYLTNDTTAPSATTQLNLNGKPWLTYQGFLMQGGSVAQVTATASHSHDITFRRCVMKGSETSVNNVQYTGTGVAANWTLDSCVFVGTASTTFLILLALAAADYNANILFKNCLFLGNTGDIAIYCDQTGAGAGLPGGVTVQNCTFFSVGTAFRIVSANYSLTFPSTMVNSVVSASSVGVQAGANNGELVEDYNVLGAATPRTNVAVGAHSFSGNTAAVSFDWGYADLNALARRADFAPRAGSSLLGFGNIGSPTPLATDILNRPRPAGGLSTSNGIGAFERHDTGAREAVVIDASTYSLRLTGPADHDLAVPVTAVATTITVRNQYDANHGTGSPPQVILLASNDIGVTGQTVTAPGSSGVWATLTIGPFTPTAMGWVKLRLVSRAAAGNGSAYFDTITSSVAIGTGSEDYWRWGEAFPAATTTGAGSSGSLLYNPGLEGL